MNSKQKSTVFWIIFIVIAAIIAVIIFPKYGFLSKEFHITEARNIAANLTSSTAANYTLRKSDPSKGTAIKDCRDVMNIIGNRLPMGYQISDQTITPDDVAICILKGPDDKTTQFSVIGIS